MRSAHQIQAATLKCTRLRCHQKYAIEEDVPNLLPQRVRKVLANEGGPSPIQRRKLGITNEDVALIKQIGAFCG